VQVKAQPMQRVEAGDVLYEIDAPEWLSCQRRLHDLTTERGVTAARLDAMTPLLAAHEAHEQSLQDAQQVMRARIEQLTTTQQEVGGQAEQMTAARLQLSQVSAQLAEASEKHANLIATLAELRANTTALESRFAFEIDAAAAIADRIA
jgi:chromosome segregation ATPase